MNMFGLVDPQVALPAQLRARRTWKRLFAETGVVRGTGHELASTLRQVNRIAESRRAVRRVRWTREEREDLALLERDWMLRGEIAPDELRGAVLELAASLQKGCASVGIEQVRAVQGGHNHFFCNVYGGETGDAFRRLATSPALVRRVAGYLGEVPQLQDIEYNFSPAYVPDSSRWSGSQLWHVDHDQSRRIKVFVNTHDMRSEHGPTLVLDRARSRLALRPNFPGCFRDEEARGVGVDPSCHRELTGAAGTLHLVDTARLVHCGSRAVHTPRFLLVLTYGPLRSRLSSENERRCLAGAHLAAERRQIEELFQ
jgi:hypothetical protein